MWDLPALAGAGALRSSANDVLSPLIWRRKCLPWTLQLPYEGARRGASAGHHPADTTLSNGLPVSGRRCLKR